MALRIAAARWPNNTIAPKAGNVRVNIILRSTAKMPFPRARMALEIVFLVKEGPIDSGNAVGAEIRQWRNPKECFA